METVGKATWEHSIRSLKPGGTLVVSGATTGDADAGAAEPRVLPAAVGDRFDDGHAGRARAARRACASRRVSGPRSTRRSRSPTPARASRRCSPATSPARSSSRSEPSGPGPAVRAARAASTATRFPVHVKGATPTCRPAGSSGRSCQCGRCTRRSGAGDAPGAGSSDHSCGAPYAGVARGHRSRYDPGTRPVPMRYSHRPCRPGRQPPRRPAAAQRAAAAREAARGDGPHGRREGV